MALDLGAGELGIYLNLTEVDEVRAEFLLEQAVGLAESIVKPLPDNASAVVLAVAGRAYANPQGVAYETVGPISVQRPQPGLYLTRSDKATLRRLAGLGGAFTVDPTPADADPTVTWPGAGLVLDDDPHGGWAQVSGPGAY